MQDVNSQADVDLLRPIQGAHLGPLRLNKGLNAHKVLKKNVDSPSVRLGPKWYKQGVL